MDTDEPSSYIIDESQIERVESKSADTIIVHPKGAPKIRFQSISDGIVIETYDRDEEKWQGGGTITSDTACLLIDWLTRHLS